MTDTENNTDLPEEPTPAMLATAPEDDDPRELVGELVPDDEMWFDEEVDVP